MLTVHEKTQVGEEGSLTGTLDELAREGARRMLAAALEAEVASYLDDHQGERDEQGHRLVVRNGRAQPRTVTLGAGAVAGVRAFSTCGLLRRAMIGDRANRAKLRRGAKHAGEGHRHSLRV